MTVKTAIVALTLGLAPVAGLACQFHENQAQSCAPGAVWDAQVGQCVKQATS